MSFSMREAKNAWMYNKCKDLEKLIVVADYSNERNDTMLSIKTNDEICDVALSILLVALGRNIPKRIYTMPDYVDFCDVLYENQDKLRIEDD